MLTEDDNAILASPGAETSIEISRTLIEKLPYPYSDCITHKNLDLNSVNNLIWETVNHTGIYTQQHCLQMCFEDFLHKFCNCCDHKEHTFHEGEESEAPKSIEALYDCQYKIRLLFYNGENDQNCLDRCPIECESLHFYTRVSAAKFPSQPYSEILNSIKEKTPFKDHELNEESTAALNIYFKRDASTRIKERPHLNLELFVSNLGGILGLFIGISLLSCCELVELLMEIFMWNSKAFTFKLSKSKKQTVVV